VHAPNGTGVVDLGDVIEIEPCRPISKEKHFSVGKIVKKRM
jgi:ribosomal protein S17